MYVGASFLMSCGFCMVWNLENERSGFRSHVRSHSLMHNIEALSNSPSLAPSFRPSFHLPITLYVTYPVPTLPVSNLNGPAWQQWNWLSAIVSSLIHLFDMSSLFPSHPLHIACLIATLSLSLSSLSLTSLWLIWSIWSSEMHLVFMSWDCPVTFEIVLSFYLAECNDDLTYYSFYSSQNAPFTSLSDSVVKPLIVLLGDFKECLVEMCLNAEVYRWRVC